VLRRARLVSLGSSCSVFRSAIKPRDSLWPATTAGLTTVHPAGGGLSEKSALEEKYDDWGSKECMAGENMQPSGAANK
jgi:hypothetical protein